MSEQSICLLTFPQVIARVGLQKSWIYSAIKRGAFPAPVQTISTRRTLFSSHDIDSWIAEKTASTAARESR